MIARNTRLKIVSSLLIAAVICLSASAAIALGTSSDANASEETTGSTIAVKQGLASLASSAANAWQVEAGYYEGNGADNKTISTDGNVGVQKNVVPTGTENEFLTYLSIDYRAALKNYFESATYQATESNKNHGEEVGTVVSSIEGSKKVQVAAGKAWDNSGTFTVVDPSGNTIAKNVTISWSKANNVTFYLKVDDSHYVLFGTSVKMGSSNNVALSAEAWNLIRQEAVKTALGKVTDVMGDNIEYVETVASDGATSYDHSSKTLTWTPSVKTACETESYTSNGETFTWYRTAAELVYRVRLTPSESTGLNDAGGSISPGSDAICDVNSKATLTYNGSSTVDFPVPRVKGLLYDVVFTKVSEDANTALPGATFKLQKQTSEGNWIDVEDADGSTLIAISDGNGRIAFTNLQYGTYRAVETEAPSGYKSTDANGNPLTWGPSTPLCWTTNSANLMPSSAVNANAMAAESATATLADPRSLSLMVLKQDENGNPLAGATFTLVKNGEAAGKSAETSNVGVVKDSASENAAAATFTDLENGTYTLTESRVAAGYLTGADTSFSLTVSSEGISIEDSEGTLHSLNILTCDGAPFYYLSVTNRALPDLPATGGVGDACGYALGTAALLTAAGLFAHRRKRGNLS